MTEQALAAFAHEVRTPLTGILAISELLATAGLGPRERHWVETIKASAQHLSALATLFVDAAKADAVGLTLARDFFDVEALARAAGASLSGRAAAKGLTATVTIDGSLAGFVWGDAVRLRAALENLIDNAVKFTDEGTVSLTATARARARGRLEARFDIADSGIGIGIADMRKLFRPFSQTSAGIARRFGGAGLGLSSVRALARAMGGNATIAPRPGGGVVLSMSVVLDRAEANDRAAWPGMSVPARATGPSLHVLCVEDSPFGRVILNTILTELGHRAEFVERGEAAASLVSAGGIDAVLMDLILPGINGLETIAQIRSLPVPASQTPILAVSGHSADESQALKAGADAFLGKPVSAAHLAAALSDIVGRARPAE